MRRWAIVIAVVAVLLALPAAVAAWPASNDDRSAADLRTAVLASAAVPFSGFVESTGGLALPATDQLSSLADLLSDRTEMGVWWRGLEDNRVDVVTAGGETGVYRDPSGTPSTRGSQTVEHPSTVPGRQRSRITSAPIIFPRADHRGENDAGVTEVDDLVRAERDDRRGVQGARTTRVPPSTVSCQPA